MVLATFTRCEMFSHFALPPAETGGKPRGCLRLPPETRKQSRGQPPQTVEHDPKPTEQRVATLHQRADARSKRQAIKLNNRTLQPVQHHVTNGQNAGPPPRRPARNTEHPRKTNSSDCLLHTTAQSSRIGARTLNHPSRIRPWLKFGICPVHRQCIVPEVQLDVVEGLLSQDDVDSGPTSLYTYDETRVTATRKHGSDLHWENPQVSISFDRPSSDRRSPSEVGSEIPSARFRSLCLHLARVVLVILHTLQFGSFGKYVDTL